METSAELRQSKIIIALAAAYISLTLFANIGSLRIVALIGLAVDGGTLLYPFTFTLRDILHKKAGAAIARFAIWLAAAINLLLFGFIWLVAALPAAEGVGAQAAYAQVLLPGLRLVIASVAAMTVAELLDTFIYARVRRRWGHAKQWLRVLLSNAVSVPVDTAVFLLIAFLGRYTWPVLASIFLANLLIKYLVSLLSLGGVYLVRDADRE